MTEVKRGVVLAAGAHLLWGMFPLYFRMLHGVPAVEIVAHRALWSFVGLVGVFAVLRSSPFRQGLPSLRDLRSHSVSALLILTNWLVYIWGVESGHVVECALGYFINPLVSVVLGVVFLKERLRGLQWIALALVVLAVGWLAIAYGAIPWIALALAFSFGGYGLARKTSRFASASGLFLETLLLFPFAAAGLLWAQQAGIGHFAMVSRRIDLLLVLTGFVTTVPLLMFASGARRIPLSMVGFIQYLTPTLQFLLGIFVFREDFPPERLVGFSLVWTGLALLGIEAAWRGRRGTKPPGLEREYRSVAEKG